MFGPPQRVVVERGLTASGSLWDPVDHPDMEMVPCPELIAPDRDWIAQITEWMVQISSGSAANRLGPLK
ncbi:hypothetical protein chiPu_0025843 [Chiloscyllium punctatum]|uniref:Uncharacterized protein n=1 Tax=Chiloscyllium punctatum TaxID=137246 RepID=A0A401TGA0_CHIPU|nr:hypothetical protein [Chiloscyllium punctatum]